jgi:cobalamin biosynthesis Mg chelatase CobN
MHRHDLQDRMVGYLSFLKVGPALLKFLPGQKARDLRTWLTAYSYWNQGGLGNVVALFQGLVREAFALEAPPPPAPPPRETPATGCLHPAAPGRVFASPAEYMAWYRAEGPLRLDPGAPVVAVLLYRKHVITAQVSASLPPRACACARSPRRRSRDAPNVHAFFRWHLIFFALHALPVFARVR